MEKNNYRCGYYEYHIRRYNHNFLLNTILHHVGMLWIIETNEKLQYDMDEQNSECMTGGSWYNTYICKKLHGILFEGFIINSITDRYHQVFY